MLMRDSQNLLLHESEKNFKRASTICKTYLQKISIFSSFRKDYVILISKFFKFSSISFQSLNGV